jgi:hypothetical protein
MQQGDGDERADVALAGELGVHTLVGLGVEAQQGAAAAHGVAGKVVSDGQAVRFGELRRPAHRPADQGVAVEQAHRRRYSAGQLAGAVGYALHDRLEVEAHGGELVLHGDRRAQDARVHLGVQA